MSEDKNPQIIISEDCTRCGTCVAMFPDIFEFADDGSVVVKEDADLEGIDIDELEQTCPVAAIKVKE